MTLSQAKKIYDGEWIAFKKKSCRESENPEGNVLLHHKDRWTLDKKLFEMGKVDLYITFAGPLVKEGFAVMF
ncbi:MAG: hypothetical protein HY738_06950 [Bacteroidia bacterium]|nr:hypothetical protein [Bacteroidia bacterium]